MIPDRPLTCDVCDGVVEYGSAQVTPEDVICEDCVRRMIGRIKEYRRAAGGPVTPEFEVKVDRKETAP
jgi:hypothetical protein